MLLIDKHALFPKMGLIGIFAFLAFVCQSQNAVTAPVNSDKPLNLSVLGIDGQTANDTVSS